MNLMTASSRIKDVDHAHEASELARTQIQFDTGKAALSQAQNISKTILQSIFSQK